MLLSETYIHPHQGWIAMYCTVPVYLRRGSISAESQHPAHTKKHLWAGQYRKSCWESFTPSFLFFLNDRMQFLK